jgi:hypothetical protein
MTDEKFSVLEQRCHDTAVSVAQLIGEFKGFREDIKLLSEAVDTHSKQSLESHLNLEKRLQVVESDVNTAKKGLKAVFDKVWPVFIAALLGALVSKGIISDDAVAQISKVVEPTSQE